MKTRSILALLVLTFAFCLQPSVKAQTTTNNPPPARLPNRTTQTIAGPKRPSSDSAPPKPGSAASPDGATQQPGAKVTEQVPKLPDLVIVASNEFTGTECTKGYAFAEKQHWLQIPSPPPEYLCWGVRVRNAGRANAGVNILQVILVGNNGDVRKIEAKVPALRQGQDVWVPVKMPWTTETSAYGFTATFVELKSLAATVDINQQVAEVNENNNSFSKNVTGTFSGNVTDNTGGGLLGDGKYASSMGIGTGDNCELVLAPGSKVFVLNSKLNINLIFWNTGQKGTCLSETKPNVTVKVFRYGCEDFVGWALPPTPPCLEPALEIIPAYHVGPNSNPGSWGTASAVNQISCNARCQQECANPDSAKQCWAKVELRDAQVNINRVFRIGFNETLKAADQGTPLY
jgi:hypothetical protein